MKASSRALLSWVQKRREQSHFKGLQPRLGNSSFYGILVVHYIILAAEWFTLTCNYHFDTTVHCSRSLVQGNTNTTLVVMSTRIYFDRYSVGKTMHNDSGGVPKRSSRCEFGWLFLNNNCFSQVTLLGSNNPIIGDSNIFAYLNALCKSLHTRAEINTMEIKHKDFTNNYGIPW